MSLSPETIVEYERLHAEAMNFANDAFTHRYLGRHDEAVEAFRRAWQREEAAAMLLRETELEPSRSISFRSAASLALLCGEYKDARRLARLGLDGAPEPRVRRMLDGLLVLADVEERVRS